VLLRALDYVFKMGRTQRGAMLEDARRAMYNVDDVNRSLSERGLGALFTIPRVARAPAGSLVHSAHDIGEPLRPHFDLLRGTGQPELMTLGDRMEGKLATLTAHMKAAAEES
jgi:hypothetical protein